MQRIFGYFSQGERFARIIRDNAQDSANVIFTPHARQRMDERDILDADVLRVLRNGDFKGDVEQAKEQDGRKLKMVYRLRGNRDVGVVATVFSNTTRLIVVTVEWEDF